MKLNSVNNTIVNNRSYNTNGVASNNQGGNASKYTTFKGFDFTTALIEYRAAIARGGVAASFTEQDMLGTNFPRTLAALDRNKDITGKNNYKAAVEVAIREFTTGPSMFIVPTLVLAAASRMSGTANRVPTDNISAFSEIVKNTMADLDNGEFANANFQNMSSAEARQAANTVKKHFYKDVFTEIFNQYKDGSEPVNIDEYVDLMLKAEDSNTPKRNFFKRMFKKKAVVLGREVDAKDEIISQIQEKFVADKKSHTKGWGNFLTAKIPQNGKEWQITDLIDDMRNYSDDFSNSFISAKRTKPALDERVLVNKFIDNFCDKRVGSRFITGALMVVATALFMCIIPTLYTRNKTNPETDAIYEQVNQQRKGAVNK